VEVKDMKRKFIYLSLLVFAFLFSSPRPSIAANNFISVMCLTGGAFGCLDGVNHLDIEGTGTNIDLVTGDIAIPVFPTDGVYHYVYSSTDAQPNDDDDVIKPDSVGAGTGAWLKQLLPVSSGGTGASAPSGARTNLGAQQQDASLDEIAAQSFVNGDLLYYSSGALTRFGIGNDGEILSISSGAPYWANSLSLSYITLPNADNPLPTTEARIHWDKNNNMLVMGDAGTDTRVIATAVKCWEPACFYEPHDLDTSTEPGGGVFLVKNFPSAQFPGGATLTAVIIETSATCSNTINIEQWRVSGGTSWVEDATDPITLSGVSTTETSFQNSVEDVGVGESIMVDFASSMATIDWICITPCGRINTND
jgi:hypothetical protein